VNTQTDNRFFSARYSEGLSYIGLMFLLSFIAVILAGRLVYVFLGDSERFPITTVKVAASYQHVTHKELESVLQHHLSASFFLLSVSHLQKDLNAIDWVDTASVARVWPDTLKIKLVEKNPVASFNGALMTAEGKLFGHTEGIADANLPQLRGPASQQLEVLQIYEKLGKILSAYGIKASGLVLRDNQTWVLHLNHDARIYLGKKELEERLLRFCRAYPAVFAEKIEALKSVDLRYARGMAVQWKQQTGQ
jgi:cell division protein FtsQ